MSNTTTTSTGIVVYNNPNTGGSTVGSADAVAATPTATTETQTGIDQANAAIQGVADTFEGITGQSISSVESAQNIIDNPTQFLTPETSNSSIDTSIDGSAGLMDSSNPAYSLGGGSGGLNISTATGTAQTVNPNVIQNPGAVTYDPQATSTAIDKAIDNFFPTLEYHYLKKQSHN